MAISGEHNVETFRVSGLADPNADGTVAAVAAARSFAADAGLEEAVRNRLLIVVEEIFTNIANHGRSAEGSTVVYAYVCLEDVVRITVSDSGVPFDPRDLPARDPKGTARRGRQGGWGWPIIMQWCDVESYCRDGEKNHLALLFRI